ELRVVVLALDAEGALEGTAALRLDDRHEILPAEVGVEEPAEVRRRELVELTLAGGGTGGDELAARKVMDGRHRRPPALQLLGVEPHLPQPLDQIEEGQLTLLVDVEVDERMT